MQQFSAGSVMSRGAGVLAKNFLPFLVLTAIVFVPVILHAYLTAKTPEEIMAAGKVDYVQVLSGHLLNMVATNVLAGLVAYGVFHSLRGKGEVSMGERLAKGVGRLAPVLAVGIVTGVGIILGTICLIIPGIMLACAWYVAVPSAVVESPGVMGALKRSAFLTSGSRWAVFGIFVLVFLMQLAAVFIFQLLFRTLDFKLIVILSTAVGALFALFGAVCAAVAYHDLRIQKEGADVDDLIAVFE